MVLFVVGKYLMPAPNALRRIATGVYAIRKPTNGRHSYLARELADELHVNELSVSRWIARGYLRAKKSPLGFVTITVAEAMALFARRPARRHAAERPRPAHAPSRRRPIHQARRRHELQRKGPVATNDRAKDDGG